MDRARIFSLPLLLLALLAAPAAPARGGDTLVVLNKEGASAWLIDPATGGARARVPVGDGPREAAVSPDGRTAWATSIGGGTLSRIDLRRPGASPRTVDTGRGTEALALLTSRGEVWVGEVFAANRGLDHVAVVDMESWEVVRRLPAGRGPDGMAWSRLPE